MHGFLRRSLQNFLNTARGVIQNPKPSPEKWIINLQFAKLRNACNSLESLKCKTTILPGKSYRLTAPFEMPRHSNHPFSYKYTGYNSCFSLPSNPSSSEPMKMDNSTETRKQILPPKQKKETDFLW